MTGLYKISLPSQERLVSTRLQATQPVGNYAEYVVELHWSHSPHQYLVCLRKKRLQRSCFPHACVSLALASSYVDNKRSAKPLGHDWLSNPS